MNNKLKFVAIGYVVTFLAIPFVLSAIVGTDIQGFIITLILFGVFGIGGSLWIMNYANKQEKLDGEKS